VLWRCQSAITDAHRFAAIVFLLPRFDAFSSPAPFCALLLISILSLRFSDYFSHFRGYIVEKTDCRFQALSSSLTRFGHFSSAITIIDDYGRSRHDAFRFSLSFSSFFRRRFRYYDAAFRAPLRAITAVAAADHALRAQSADAIAGQMFTVFGHAFAVAARHFWLAFRRRR